MNHKTKLWEDRTEKKYLYFVSYNHTNGKGYGFGNTTVTLSNVIRSEDIIRELEKVLKDKFDFKSLVLLNFQLINIIDNHE